MAKDTRKIKSSIRVGNRLYSEKGVFEGRSLLPDLDANDELEASGADLAGLQERGVIEGFVAKRKESEAPADPAATSSRSSSKNK